MKWLIVSSHDERYDFNLELKIFNGTIEDFEKSIDCDYIKEEKTKWRNGIYVYHTENRSNKYCTGLDDSMWNKLKENIEVVTFSTTILIPFEYLNDENFILQNPIVNRNLKYGFLDIIDKK